MRKERFNDSLKISEFTRRTLLKRDWVAAAVEIASFEIYE